MNHPISSIIVNRDERQRRELVGIEELALSISKTGLINPIVIDENGLLIAGERRLTACKALGWTDIPVTLFSDLSDYDRQLIELEENIRRVDLSWQDQAAAIAKLHSLLAQDEGWTSEQTGEHLGLSGRTVRNYLMVQKEIEAGNAQVATADKLSVAVGVASRANERRASSSQAVLAKVLDEVEEEAVEAVGEEPSAPIPAVSPLLLADFAEWRHTYTGPQFNMLHCDFPYGVGMHNSDQGSGQAFGTYADDEDVYWKLLQELQRFIRDGHVAESAHMIFWFSMDYYEQTIEELQVMGWSVSPFPLIWFKSDNTGILPDAKRQPRRIYETAFFCTRGDRQLATGPYGQGPVANAVAFPGKGKTLHMNEKPVEMLRHFMRLCVDEYSVVLDPTAGSANSLRAARLLGASSVLGLERDPDFFATATAAGF